MFYELEDPNRFMRSIEAVLADDGIWHFEQSYMPLILETKAYDTICQEHIEYYGLAQIKWMADRAGLEILDVELNKVNGGSFAGTVAKCGSRHGANTQAVKALLQRERDLRLDIPGAYAEFVDAV